MSAIFNDQYSIFNDQWTTFAGAQTAPVTNLLIYNFPNNIAGSPTPIFSWTPSIPYTQYNLQISSTNSFANPQYNITFTTALQPVSYQYLLSPEFSLLYEGTYYARISGYNGIWGQWSSTLTFKVHFLPNTPPVVNPVTSPANAFTQTITGTKLIGLYVYISNNGAAWQEATYPNTVGGSLWRYVVNLVPGNNEIQVVTSYNETTVGALSNPVIVNIYLGTLTPQPYNVWNAFDEQGLLLSLQRNPGEKNIPYKNRLLDVYANPGNSTYTGLVNGISRELGLQHDQITVNTLSSLMDPTFAGNLLNDDGNAIGTPLEAYAEEVYLNNPVFLGTIISDESYWDGVSQNTNGYIFLPHIWDATAAGVYPKWQAGGIGDHDDLWVTGPVQVWNSGIADYNWYLQIHTGFFYSCNPSGLI